MAIPLWSNGIIPPIREGQSANSLDRSPYFVGLSEFIERFASSTERCSVLEDFLNFRKELHSLGITSGFQWVNGSFVEDVETIRGRAPGDIDVVTFYSLPEGESREQLSNKMGKLYESDYCSENFSVDSYYQELGNR